MNLRNLDLYTGIVLASLLLLPVGGWWIMKLQDEIDQSRAAIHNAQKRGGLLEEIGSLQEKINLIERNRSTTSDAIQSPDIYFQGQILAASAGTLRTNDFSPKAPKEENAVIPDSKQRASDFVVDVVFDKQVKAKMDFVYAMLFMCESGARFGGAPTSPSVWRLRELELINETNPRAVQSHEAPDAEMTDVWSIKNLSFARREPKRQ